MLVTAIDYRTCVVTLVSGDLEMPVQMDLDLIPYLRVGDTLESAEREYSASVEG